MTIIPGLALALLLAISGQYLSTFIGTTVIGLAKSPVSGIMLAILLGIVMRNTIALPNIFEPGIRFGLVRVLRVGIVLLGIRLSFGELGAVGLQSLPVIIGTVTSALLIVTYLTRKLGLSRRLGTLIAVGTSVCGATAIVAMAPTIHATDEEVSYSVACVTLFGIIAMLVYPFAAHWFFDANPFTAGLFLGTAVHETAQVAGAGMAYQQYYGAVQALDVATVTKLIRNLGMLVIIPVIAVIYHRSSDAQDVLPRWWTMVPLFVVGFACMSLLRTVGDRGDMAFGVIPAETWIVLVANIKDAAELCLTVAMAAVGLGTSIKGLLSIGGKPLAMGLVAALLVGGVSATLISVLY
jgi:uncharacterized integral membrane protein (TIGR00698 family)